MGIARSRRRIALRGHPVILVTGAGGQVGTALRGLLGHARFASRAELDVRDGRQVEEALEGVGCVVHLAAFTDVDGCERDPDLAHAVNAEGTKNVAHAASETGARLIYISTDYVFDGRSQDPYREEDPVAPLNVYGETKEAGERYVRAVPGHLIVRTSWVFGQGRNFIRTIAELGRTQDTIEVVEDQRGRPTYAVDLAAAIAFLVQGTQEGTLHVTGDGQPCSWADLAERVVAATGGAATVRRIDTPTFVASRPGPVASRPANSVLDLTTARNAGVPLRAWEDGVESYLRGGR